MNKNVINLITWQVQVNFQQVILFKQHSFTKIDFQLCKISLFSFYLNSYSQNAFLLFSNSLFFGLLAFRPFSPVPSLRVQWWWSLITDGLLLIRSSRLEKRSFQHFKSKKMFIRQWTFDNYVRFGWKSKLIISYRWSFGKTINSDTEIYNVFRRSRTIAKRWWTSTSNT